MTETTAIELARSFAQQFPFVDLGLVMRARLVTLSDYEAEGLKRADGAADTWLVCFRRVPMPIGSAMGGVFDEVLFRVNDTSGSVELIQSL